MWSKWLTHDRGECIDDGGDDVPNVVRNFKVPVGTYLRLAACTQGYAEGSFRLPISGNWLIHFFVGVPRYTSLPSSPTAGSYPEESEGYPVADDTLEIVLNNRTKVMHNLAAPGPGGERQVYWEVFDGVSAVDFSFNFTSRDEVDHMHMLVSGAEAVYVGDDASKAKALSLLGGTDARVSGKVENAVDGRTLKPGRKVGNGYVKGVVVPDGEEATVNLFVGSSLVSTLDVAKGEYDQGVATGKYTCQTSFPGYYSFYDDDCTVHNPTGMEKNSVLSPFLNPGDARFLLVWGATPPDLELRLDVPLPGYVKHGSMCVVRYTNTHCTAHSKHGKGKAKLEHTSLNGFGPETISVRGWVPGKYVLRVKHHAGANEAGGLDKKTNHDPALLDSGAEVQTYMAEGARRYHIGSHGYTSGVDWLVVRIDGTTQEVELCTPEICPPPGKWD
eukprot:CAMPEP_0173430836 /NCGR_PEP_ID=MMETSP1357-20121228/9158_1 /TAXON_ID=77926 /ORGANISM="Hemiselmis rufescens, Strain PCC563" /LENGTH=443 /DNA_ID=CAMNT_0014395241 /DNA_START=10 /DNA_END=1341 /DNA_ORIENTATION=-